MISRILLFIIFIANFLNIFSIIFYPKNLFALDLSKSLDQNVHTIWQIKDGLPQNSIFAITQTKDGYIWLGTEEGLVRFDGVKFTVFDKQNTPFIKSNFINTLAEDKNGNLWVGTRNGGLICYKDGKFKLFTIDDGLSSNKIYSLYFNKEGDLWIGTWEGGLNLYKDGKFTSYKMEHGLTSNNVNVVYVDINNSVWIGTRDRGLNLLKDDKFTIYTTEQGLSNNHVSSINEDKSGGIWVGTWGGGLNLYKNGKLKIYNTQNKWANGQVRIIYKDNEENLWVGAGGGGLNLFKNGEFISYTMKHGLSNNQIGSIYNDKEGNLWVGTHGGGLNLYKNGKFTPFTALQGLSNEQVTAINIDNSDNLWIGTWGGGLNLYKNGKFISFTTKQGLSNDLVRVIYNDTKGNLWIGTNGGGLSLYKKDKFITFTGKHGLSNNLIRAIYEDKKGNLWVGTKGGGVNLYKNGKFTSFTTKQGLSNDLVMAILEDKDSNLWIGTHGGGINRFKDGKFTAYTKEQGLSDDHIMSIYEDKEGNLWIGTWGGGLNLYKDGKFTSYTTKQGLFDDSIWVIFEDNHNNLWMSCNKGVFKVRKNELLDLAKGKIYKIKSTSYGLADGMKSRECIGLAGFKSKDGKLWFGTIKGAVMIDPENIKINKLEPPVHIEKIIANGKKIDITKSTKLNQDTDKLEFHYAGLSYVSPKKVLFKYMLQGFDSNWIDVGTRRVAYYTNLPPGDYIFRVKACNNDGVWNKTGAKFSFKKLPYFYQTYWFFALCGLAVIFLGVGFYIIKMRQIKDKQKQLEEFNIKLKGEIKKATKELRLQQETLAESNVYSAELIIEVEEANDKLKELDKQKTHFFQNVSHELRTPLTLIMNPLEEVSEEQPEENRIQMALKNSKRLLRLVNQLLDFQKISAGKMKLHLKPLNLVNFIYSCALSFTPACKKKNIIFKKKINDKELVDGLTKGDLLFINAEIDALEKIVFNLLSNALKFTPENGIITLSLDISSVKKDEIVKISVSDTGPGICKDDQKKLFKVFSQVDEEDVRAYEGTGLGLALVKELTEAMNGKAGVNSEVGKGSLFFIDFPLLKPEKHFAVDEKIEIKGFYLEESVNLGNKKISTEVEDYHENLKDKELILVVDDIKDMRDLLKYALIKKQYKVVTANDGKNGFDIAKKYKPELIITDWMMPVMSGPDMIKEIKTDKELMYIPVILLTAKSDEESKVEGTELGADGFLGKPFNNIELFSLVKNLLQLKKREREVENAYIELKNTQDQLVRSEKLSSIGVLSAGICHEINNPNNFISMNSRLVNSELILFEQYLKPLEAAEGAEDLVTAMRKSIQTLHESLNSIQSGSMRINDVVNGLQTFSQIHKTKKVKVDVNKLLKNSLHGLTFMMNENIDINWQLLELNKIKCEADAIEQVFMHILRNSIQAIKDKGKIIISSKQVDKKIEIIIQDTGKGIPNDIIMSVFDPFFTTLDVGKGLGLGLTISGNILEAHGGTINIESKQNEFTKVVITLPI